MSNYLNKIVTLIALAAMLFSGSALAQHSESIFNFKFKHLSNVDSNDNQSLLDTDMQTFDHPALIKTHSIQFTQYDATWTYPWETKSMSIDLGVTLRHLSGMGSAEGIDNVRFDETLPMLHASALYNFSFKGLSAGFEGSHLNSAAKHVSDYRAKVSYEWRNGFGLQGGWQHQKFSFDKYKDNATDYETTGPFLDLYLNF